MKRHTLASILVAGLLILSACSGAEQTAVDTTTAGHATTTSISGSQLSAEPLPPPEFDSDLTGDDLLVAIEGRWMCDVQRFAYSDLSAVNAALDERLSAYGLSRTDYDTFKADLEGQIDLRERVLVEYDNYCGEG